MTVLRMQKREPPWGRWGCEGVGVWRKGKGLLQGSPCRLGREDTERQDKESQDSHHPQPSTLRLSRGCSQTAPF